MVSSIANINSFLHIVKQFHVGWLVGWLVVFYDLATLMSYLMPETLYIYIYIYIYYAND